MNKQEIETKLREVFNLVLSKDASNISLDANIMTDLGVNSVGLIYMIIGIEKTFDIDMSEVTFNTFKTVGDVVDFIYKKLN